MKHVMLALALVLLVPALGHAEERKRFYFRAGVAHVAPLEQGNEMELVDVDGPASLAIQSGPIAGSGASISSATAFAATIGWNTPWLDNRLAIETIIGIPFTVTFEATGTLANESLAPTALGIPTGIMRWGRSSARPRRCRSWRPASTTSSPASGSGRTPAAGSP